MTLSYRPVARPTPTSPVLSKAQMAVVGLRRGTSLLLGGPRSGKTTAAIEAAIWELDHSDRPVLFITGSRRERFRIRAAIAGRAPLAKLNVTTFYSLALGIGQHGAEPMPTLLSAARQDSHIRQILAGQPETAWPPEFAIVRTAAIFADDLREAVVACQRAGLSPAAVEEQGIRQGRAELVSLARFYQEYLDIIALAQVVDYPELLLLACRQLADAATRQLVRPPGSLLIVDSFEDVDDLQGQVLDGLVDGLSPTIVTWDPDRGIDSFRGAALRSQATLVERWVERDGLAIT
ncbi:MAG: AAA family ATPase, partial [Propionibacteriaceae bacterium]|nr:AAA family ATPase [Propionibacteriaceae bacterium]